MRNVNILKTIVFHTFLVIFALVGCTAKDIDPTDPKASYAVAKEPYDDGNYEMALTKLGEFKSRFPYSQYAIEAELLIANAHFELKQYIEAAAAYEQFVKLHPKHPKVDFAEFRIGESYWADSPEEPDREQEFTERAINAWKSMLVKRPQSPYRQQAEKMIVKGEARIAASIDFIANFYCKQEIYHSCAYRSQQLAERFAHLKEIRQKALKRAAYAYFEMAKIKKKDSENTDNLFFRSMNATQLQQKGEELKALSEK